MTNLEQNIEVLRYLNSVNPNEFKDVKLDGSNLIYKGNSVSLEKINIKNIVDSNEQLSKEIYTIKMEALFDILKINSNVVSSSLKTENFNIKDRNTELINQIKKDNNILKNITVINKDHDFLHEQYFNIVDSNGKTHIFKNDRDFNIASVVNEYLMNNEKSLDYFISLISRYLPEITLDNSINLEDNSYVSEDFRNKIESVKKEFEGKQGVYVSGNEKENLIIITDTLHPENNETRTYKKDKEGNLVTEKYATEDISKQDENKNEDISIEQDLEDKTNKEEVAIELIPFNDFIKLNNSPLPHNKEQEEQIKLWEQTLGDMYIYEEYLSQEVLQFLKKYQFYISGLEVDKEQGLVNSNQLAAINKFNELTDPNVKKEKLENMSEERKNNISRKLEKDTNNKAGKVSLVIILCVIMVSCLSIIYLISTMFR